jgi:hypothetical protein
MACHVCGKSFEITPAWARGGRRKYCSRRCNAKASLAGKRTGTKHRPESIERMRANRSGKATGEHSHAWKGGRFLDQNGYRYVAISTLTGRTLELAEAMVSGRRPYIREHRLVMAALLDRPLAAHEVIHHQNGVKDDNRPENLFLRDQTSHSLEHRMIDRELARLQARVGELEAENADLRSRVT